MTTNDSDFDPDAFMTALRASNAEDLKNRILTKTEAILKSHEFNNSHLKQINIDVSDYLNTGKSAEN